ncbi:MAG: snoRNA-binding protein [Bogoriella megaspora]|nr:MAG: snoRNA-binding protein [Bogoriella megaspora]
MAKTDSSREERKKAKKDKKEKKRPETDGVHKKHKHKKTVSVNGDAEAGAEEIAKWVLPVGPKVEVTIEEEVESGGESDLNIPITTNRQEVIALIKQNADGLAPIADPLAPESLEGDIFTAVKRAEKAQAVKRGVKEVVKAINKAPKLTAKQALTRIDRVVILAADIWPIDVISHIPVLCEDFRIPYVFVRSRDELGRAGNTKRPTSVIMVTKDRRKPKTKKEGEGAQSKLTEEAADKQRAEEAEEKHKDEKWEKTYDALATLVKMESDKQEN